MGNRKFNVTLKWADIKNIQSGIEKKKGQRLTNEAKQALETLSSQLPMNLELSEMTPISDNQPCKIEFELSERHAKMLSSLLSEYRSIAEPLAKSVVN